MKLIMNDGTEINNAEAFTSSGVLWVYIHSKTTMAKAFGILNSPAKTRIIRSVNGTNTETFTGYTDLFCLRKEDDGSVNAGIRKAV